MHVARLCKYEIPRRDARTGRTLGPLAFDLALALALAVHGGAHADAGTSEATSASSDPTELSPRPLTVPMGVAELTARTVS
jgi:hypothetical protein